MGSSEGIPWGKLRYRCLVAYEYESQALVHDLASPYKTREKMSKLNPKHEVRMNSNENEQKSGGENQYTKADSVRIKFINL